MIAVVKKLLHSVHALDSQRAWTKWVWEWSHSSGDHAVHLGPESPVGQDPSLKSIFPLHPSALEALINFAYNGHLAIDQQNVQSLLMGASFLQLQSIKDACCTFLRERWGDGMGLACGREQTIVFLGSPASLPSVWGLESLMKVISWKDNHRNDLSWNQYQALPSCLA